MSKSEQMLGWLRAAIARASRSKRVENCSCELLIATMRSTRVSRAFHTSPMPPAPRGDMISYGPKRIPGAKLDIAPQIVSCGIAKRRHREQSNALHLCENAGRYWKLA